MATVALSGIITPSNVVTATSTTTLTNKTISGASNTLTNIPLSTGVTGTLPVANGGTGQTSYTDGQLLIGNSTGNTLTKATLTAGTNVTITNAAGAITIAASGSSQWTTSGSDIYYTTGNVLIGSTSNSSNSKLRVYASGQNNIETERETTGAAGHFSFVNPNGSVGSIQTNGSTTVYNTSSDYRLKNTIAPMTGALAKIALLKPCTYKWNVDGSNGEGFIAHELAEVVPQCVSGEKDAIQTYLDDNGDEKTRPTYQGIDVSFLVATLTAAIQEQQTMIASLKARLDAANL